MQNMRNVVALLGLSKTIKPKFKEDNMIKIKSNNVKIKTRFKVKTN